MHLEGVFCVCSVQILQFYFKFLESMKYILSKYKPKKSGGYLFTATSALKGYENHKEALTTKITSHRAEDVFWCNFCLTKFWSSMKFKKAQQIKDTCLLLVDSVNLLICVSLTFYNMVFASTFVGWGY